MAKKKRGKKQTPAPAPKREKEQAQKSAPKPQGERVIDQLFGSLESEPDIESDIAQLGSEAPPDEPAAEPKQKNKGFFFGFAVFVIVMAIIGCVATVRFVADSTARMLDNTSLKNEFAQYIFPVVVNDIPPFEKAADLPNASVINCSIWNILINKDTELYENKDYPGALTIPEYDVMVSCRELFGSGIEIEHQTVGTNEVRFTYDEENHVYNASKNIRYLTYAPSIVSMEADSNGMYKLIVGYLPPTVASVVGLNGMEAVPDKYMEFTIEYWDKKMTLVSVRFSDYQPDVSEG